MTTYLCFCALSSRTTSHSLARLLRLRVFCSGRTRLEVPTLMTCKRVAAVAAANCKYFGDTLLQFGTAQPYSRDNFNCAVLAVETEQIGIFESSLTIVSLCGPALSFIAPMWPTPGC